MAQKKKGRKRSIKSSHVDYNTLTPIRITESTIAIGKNNFSAKTYWWQKDDPNDPEPYGFMDNRDGKKNDIRYFTTLDELVKYVADLLDLEEVE